MMKNHLLEGMTAAFFKTNYSNKYKFLYLMDSTAILNGLSLCAYWSNWEDCNI